MVSSSVILDFVEIVYFVPALPFTIWVCVKHGFSREAGWLLLTILSLVRIVGAATGVAAWKEPTNKDLIATSIIMGSIGSATLVAALTGVVNRIDTGTGGSSLSPRLRKWLQIVGLVAVILGIVGGINLADSDPETRSDGQSYIKASIILVFTQFVATAIILSLSAKKLRYIWKGDRILFFVAAACLPFVLVRLIYSISAAFNPTSSIFSVTSGTVAAVAVRATLGTAMEIIAVTLLIFGGLRAPRMRQGEVLSKETSEDKHEQFPQQHRLDGTTFQPVTHGQSL